jgi:glycosyltransferase involved in cell wall biosynthesis
MKILWICPFFLHPTDRGAQIRTLGTLKELHKRHEIHFAALNDPRNLEGPRRSSEYSTRSVFVEHTTPRRNSLGIIPQLVGSLISAMPLAVSRYASRRLRSAIDALIAAEQYDAIVCDFLAAAPNITKIEQCVLFQHNVETTIWQRHVEQCHSFFRRLFFRLQARRMEAYERKNCRAAKHVIAVSEIDSLRMKRIFHIDNVTSVPTGVDVEYFAPRGAATCASDIVFCGSMDWLPNVDAVEYFLRDVLPLIRNKIPGTTFTIAGRSPDARVLKAAQGISGVTITGKVDDMRPYLWGAKLSIVPIRIGGGTRLKIYECMAAGVPVVSTTVGAEGLRYSDGADIIIADDPGCIAAACIRLLTDEAARSAIAHNALKRAQSEFSWEAVSREFEAILDYNRVSNTEGMR